MIPTTPLGTDCTTALLPGKASGEIGTFFSFRKGRATLIQSVMTCSAPSA